MNDFHRFKSLPGEKKRRINFFDIVAPVYEKFPGARRTYQKLDRLANFSKTDRLLDLGGGMGRIAKLFSDRVAEVVVVDPSAGMIQECRKQKNLNCRLASAENLPFEQDYFDKIIIVDAFHHFENHDAACREIKRVLRTGGKVIVEELNFGFLNPVFAFLERILTVPGRFYRPEELGNLFRTNGFNVRLTDQQDIIYYLIGEKRAALA